MCLLACLGEGIAIVTLLEDKQYTDGVFSTFLVCPLDTSVRLNI